MLSGPLMLGELFWIVVSIVAVMSEYFSIVLDSLRRAEEMVVSNGPAVIAALSITEAHLLRSKVSTFLACELQA